MHFHPTLMEGFGRKIKEMFFQSIPLFLLPVVLWGKRRQRILALLLSFRLGVRALPICRDCVLATHKALGFPLFLFLNVAFVEKGNGREAKVSFGGFRFLRGSGIFALVFLFRPVGSKEGAGFFTGVKKGSASVFGERRVLHKGNFSVVGCETGGAFISSPKKIDFFLAWIA